MMVPPLPPPFTHTAMGSCVCPALLFVIHYSSGRSKGSPGKPPDKQESILPPDRPLLIPDGREGNTQTHTHTHRHAERNTCVPSSTHTHTRTEIETHSPHTHSHNASHGLDIYGPLIGEQSLSVIRMPLLHCEAPWFFPIALYRHKAVMCAPLGLMRGGELFLGTEQHPLLS